MTNFEEFLRIAKMVVTGIIICLSFYVVGVVSFHQNSPINAETYYLDGVEVDGNKIDFSLYKYSISNDGKTVFLTHK